MVVCGSYTTAFLFENKKNQGGDLKKHVKEKSSHTPREMKSVNRVSERSERSKMN